MKLFIPDIGTELVLAADWTFNLYCESRNETLMELLNDPRYNREYAMPDSDPPIPVTILKGEHLRVDRIYIRKGKGMSDYSSITFFWIGKRTEPRTEHHPACKYKVRDYRSTDLNAYHMEHCDAYDVKIPRKPVRFWAKLIDVNTMEIQ